MGCASSIERSDGDIQPRRVLEVNELLNTSSQPSLAARPPPGINSSLQPGHPTLDTEIQIPSPGSNSLNQNGSLLPNQAPIPGVQHWPRPFFPQPNQQYQDPWEARGYPAGTFYRVEHFYNLDNRRHELEQAPELRETTDLRARMYTGKKKTTITKACSICLDQFSGQDSIQNNFPYSCERFCGQEGSRQIQLKQTSPEYLTPQSQNENFNSGEKQIPSPPPVDGQYFSKKVFEVKFTSSVSPISTALSTTMCPKCSVSICTRCRLLQHPDAPCPQTDLDPLLATQLEKWKIKRCPKFRAGVRRMFGCTHIECRCGAHFCFSCLEPMKKCDGQCEDDDFDDDDMSDDDMDIDSEDIDAQMAMNRTELDLGVEPYNPTVDTWSCTHSFKPIYKFDGYLSNGRILNPQNQNDTSLDCQVCWKVLSPHMPPTNNGNLGYNVEDLTSSGISNKPGWAPTTVYGEPAWMCVGKHLLCYGCPKDTWIDAETSKYRCGCSAFCLKCAKVVEGENMQFAEGGENKEINLAYDCFEKISK
ncbi:hypothetical protein V500_05479 [Pseudogymnoascus sp. VKM F-4518 (FW-2643)]|nr:hypothetical protein V500_05479 [Pseudogymnoascus sp. VKM F-4518 (FW-2643)]